MPRTTPVRDVMTIDVLSFSPDDRVDDAMKALVDKGVDAGPVVDAGGVVVGMLSTSDLIVRDARVHFPTIVNFFGVNVELPSRDRDFDDEISKALGATVGEVMQAKHIATIGPDATLEDAATSMHHGDVSRLPVVDDDGVLVGILARGDIVRALVAEQ